MQRRARRSLRDVTSATLIIVSKNDTTVPTEVAGLIRALIRSTTVRTAVLEQSKHTLVSDSERDRVADEIVKWFTAEVPIASE